MSNKITCNICNSKSFSTRFVTNDRMFNIPGVYVYKECNNCGLVFLSPQPSIQELFKHYPSDRYSPYSQEGTGGYIGNMRNYLITNFYQKTFFSRLLGLIIPHSFALPSSNKKGKFLDIGCGVAEVLVLFKKLGWEVYGKEINQKAVKIANKRGLKNVTLGTDKDVIKYPNNYFDVIRLYHVIEHVNDPSLTIKIIKKKLKNDGEIVIATPNANSPLSYFFRNFWSSIDAPRHLYLFDIKTISLLAKKNNLIVKNVNYTSAKNISGSLTYLFEGIFNKKIKFIHRFWILFYPFEWILDRLQKGDSLIVTLVKN